MGRKTNKFSSQGPCPGGEDGVGPRGAASLPPGCSVIHSSPFGLLDWVKRAGLDSVKRTCVQTDMAEKLKAPEPQNHELRQAKKTLRKAPAPFACTQRISSTRSPTAGSSHDRVFGDQRSVRGLNRKADEGRSARYCRRALITAAEARPSLGRYADGFGDTRRPSPSLDRQTPDQARFTALPSSPMAA
jgi:hypothetical protein